MAQSTETLEKMNPEAVASGARRGCWCDVGQMRASTRKSGRGREERSKNIDRRTIRTGE